MYLKKLNPLLDKIFLIVLFFLTFICCQTSDFAGPNLFSVDARGIVHESSNVNVITGLTAQTKLADCIITDRIESRVLNNGTKEFRKNLRHKKNGKQCVLIERFTPTKDGLHWEFEIIGKDAPWTTAITTQLEWQNTDGLSWWTAWGDNRPDAAEGKRLGDVDDGIWWTDPLMPIAFTDASLFYGGRKHTLPQTFCHPLVSVFDSEKDTGISLVMSPQDLIFDMELDVTSTGQMTISRTCHRISAETPVTFSMDLVRHEADWRCGLGWLVDKYPRFFNPPNPHVQEMAGCGAYSSHAVDFDAERLKRMSFKVNWKASFDFPYMGMFVPPVKNDKIEWIDMKSKPNSINNMRKDINFFTNMGFYVLCYFNVTEFGRDIVNPPPPRKAINDQDLWKDANDYIYNVLNDAILVREGDDKPIPSWKGCVAMDPGDPVYQQFLADQAKLHVEKFPSSSGICIDRMDWLKFYNPKFDDGLSWVNDKPARSLVISWYNVIRKIGKVMHENDKVIYCNPHYRRLDLLEHIDGIYDEFGQMGHSMNLCALLALRKPIMAWTIMVPELDQTPDAYFQRHLYMGAYLTAPLPGNDHTIVPSDNVDKIYFDYGPMLDALRGKQWVLEPHAVTVAENSAKANLFSVADGYVVPVTFGEKSETCRIELRHLQKQSGNDSFHAMIIHPGKTEWQPIELTEKNGVVALDVPLERGCAMLKIQ